MMMSDACRVLASLSMDEFTLAEKPFKEMSVTMDKATHNTNTIAWRRERTIWRIMKCRCKNPLGILVLSGVRPCCNSHRPDRSKYTTIYLRFQVSGFRCQPCPECPTLSISLSLFRGLPVIFRYHCFSSAVS